MRTTSEVSHDHGRRASCSLQLRIRLLHSTRLSLAGGVTAVVVGCSALLGSLEFGGVIGGRNPTTQSRTWRGIPLIRRVGRQHNGGNDLRALSGGVLKHGPKQRPSRECQLTSSSANQWSHMRKAAD